MCCCVDLSWKSSTGAFAGASVQLKTIKIYIFSFFFVTMPTGLYRLFPKKFSSTVATLNAWKKNWVPGVFQNLDWTKSFWNTLCICWKPGILSWFIWLTLYHAEASTIARFQCSVSNRYQQKILLVPRNTSQSATRERRRMPSGNPCALSWISLHFAKNIPARVKCCHVTGCQNWRTIMEEWFCSGGSCGFFLLESKHCFLVLRFWGFGFEMTQEMGFFLCEISVFHRSPAKN